MEDNSNGNLCEPHFAIVLDGIRQRNKAILVTMDNCIMALHCLLQDLHIFRLHGRSIWRRQRSSPFLDRDLLSSHEEKEFTQRMRVKRSTFVYICQLVAPVMKKDTRGGGIPLQTRVACALNRLGTSNYLLGCADLFGVSEGLASLIVRDFCKVVVDHICPLVVLRWSKANLPRIVAKFEAKHGISHIMGAIDGSHIPINAPHEDLAPFYNQKGFYSVLLQGIVDSSTVFWDWDFGWAGSLHDYTLFVNSLEGQNVMAGRYFPYKLIGDAAYPYQTWMYVPFKGTKEQLPPAKAHWNFIQSSIRMCVERAFGMLKGRWRILLRRNEMRLDHVADVVGACICLHNLCVMHADLVDDNMVAEAKRWLHEQHSKIFVNLCELATMRVLEYGRSKITRMDMNVDNLIGTHTVPFDEEVHSRDIVDDSHEMHALAIGMSMHTQLATSLYETHLRQGENMPDYLPNADCDSSSCGEE